MGTVVSYKMVLTGPCTNRVSCHQRCVQQNHTSITASSAKARTGMLSRVNSHPRIRDASSPGGGRKKYALKVILPLSPEILLEVRNKLSR
ncbi:hypothetical protein AVEN_72836-1 [Araneus ventricosus]|uniref:Uncharacterized protein n=1 Tax=Araneus ventricosus TaxID=182803 RepID=A0A4Y2FBY8_ARAVE|nr:hypothetical protein AVEN_72836-1 [Araneus ventricosus]